MLRGKAVSPVVATVIITSIMLTTVAVAVYYSTSLIDAYRQRMEYESAKELLSYAATALEQVSFGMGGARYVRFSLTSTGLNFEQSSHKLELEIRGDIDTYGLSVEFRRISVRAGPLVTTVARVLYPEGAPLSELNKLIVGAGEPIVVVYENFDRGAFAYLEARRVRAIYSGITYVIEDGRQRLYNFYTIHLVEVTFGELGGVGTIPLVFRNRETEVYEYRFSSPSVIVSVKLNGIVSERRLTGKENAEGSIVIVKISQVEVATG
ncbi:MAG: hypothetical protein QXD46_08130 [Thermofilum sp.]